MNTNRITWDECFLEMASVIARRSPDPNTQVGAIIVNADHVILGAGYNGTPRGINPEDIPWEREGKLDDTKYGYIAHAEENAIYNASGTVKGATIYTSLFPCNECAKTIIQTGVREVVYEEDRDTMIFNLAKRLFTMAGVSIRMVKRKRT